MGGGAGGRWTAGPLRRGCRDARKRVRKSEVDVRVRVKESDPETREKEKVPSPPVTGQTLGQAARAVQYLPEVRRSEGTAHAQLLGPCALADVSSVTPMRYSTVVCRRRPLKNVLGMPWTAGRCRWVYCLSLALGQPVHQSLNQSITHTPISSHPIPSVQSSRRYMLKVPHLGAHPGTGPRYYCT